MGKKETIRKDPLKVISLEGKFSQRNVQKKWNGKFVWLCFFTIYIFTLPSGCSLHLHSDNQFYFPSLNPQTVRCKLMMWRYGQKSEKNTFVYRIYIVRFLYITDSSTVPPKCKQNVFVYRFHDRSKRNQTLLSIQRKWEKIDYFICKKKSEESERQIKGERE